MNIGGYVVPKGAATGMEALILVLESDSMRNVSDHEVYAARGGSNPYCLTYGELRTAVKILKEKLGVGK